MSAVADPPPPDDASSAAASPSISSADAPAPRWWRRPRLLLAGLIVLHALLLTWSALVNSVAFDEYAHLPAGASYVRYRQFGMLNLTPPLLRAIAATPVVIASAEVPSLERYGGMLQKDRYWAYAEAFQRANFDRYHRLFVLGRLPIIAISCLGLWLVWRWARELYGDHAGVAAATVYALCPNFCAHGSIVGTDAPTAVAILASAYLWWRFCRSGSMKMLAAATVVVGIAHLSKFNAVLLWLILPAIGAAVIVTDPSRPRRRILAGLVLCCIGAVVVFNVGYLFEGTFTPAGEYDLRSRAVSAIFSRLPARMPVPFPREAVLGFDALKWEVEQQFPAFLLGEQYKGSRWYYFPVALMLKLPLATLAMLGMTAWSLVRHRRPGAGEVAVIVALVVFLLGMILAADVNLGVRYILPVLPLAFVLVGRLWTYRPRLMLALLVILALENLWVAPRYLTFFNALAGGRSHGQLLLNDSNFDWGQGLIDLRKWMRANAVSRVQLGYFGRVDPHVYGIDYDLLTDVSGEPYIVISSYFLAGLPHRLPSSRGPTGWVQLDFAPQLRAKPRVAVVGGGTIHIFRREHVAEAMREARAAAGR